MLGLPAAEFCVNSETQGPHPTPILLRSPSNRRDPESPDKSVDTN